MSLDIRALHTVYCDFQALCGLSPSDACAFSAQRSKTRKIVAVEINGGRARLPPAADPSARLSFRRDAEREVQGAEADDSREEEDHGEYPEDDADDPVNQPVLRGGGNATGAAMRAIRSPAAPPRRRGTSSGGSPLGIPARRRRAQEESRAAASRPSSCPAGPRSSPRSPGRS